MNPTIQIQSVFNGWIVNVQTTKTAPTRRGGGYEGLVQAMLEDGQSTTNHCWVAESLEDLLMIIKIAVQKHAEEKTQGRTQ